MAESSAEVLISPSVKAIMNLGVEEAKSFPQPSAVVEFPGTAEQRKAAQEFPRLEDKSKLPDIRMQLGKKGGESDAGNEHEVENEAEAQQHTRRESLSDEMISGAETPEELFIGLRQLEKQLEDGNIPPNLSERYTPPKQLATMFERADMMAYKVDDLVDRGWIMDYDPDTGGGKVKDSRFDALAVKIEYVERQDSQGRYTGTEKKYNFGTPESREKLEKAYRRAIVELEARAIMGEHIGVRLGIDIRDSLETLTAIMHGGRMPKFKVDHLEAIFNMPGVAELGKTPENRVLGDQVEEAMFLNLVMLNSGNKERMLDFLERPGAKHLIAKMAKEKGQSYDEWFKTNIGDVASWEDDNSRFLTDKDKDGNEVTATWRIEAADGRRGFVTKWSNIAAWGGGPSEFGADKEKEFIENTVGGLVNSEEASWVAATMMRVVGAYASEGYVTIPGQYNLPLGEGRYISGDDTGKFHTYLFNMKEGLKGRGSGLSDMVGRFPDTAMNLFDWAQVVVGLDKDGKEIRRSIWDAWLGTAGGKHKKDLLTGKETDKLTNEEPYHRLGSLNLKSLEREFHGTFTIMQWLLGNAEGPTGVYIDAMNEEFKPEQFKLVKLKKNNIKYNQIVLNAIVLTQGSTQLYDFGGVSKEGFQTVDLTDEGVGKIQFYTIESKNVETIQRRFFKNLMAARIRSSEFATEIMPQTKEVFNIGGAGETFLKVPYINLIKLNIDEVSKPNPRTEEELRRHYLNDLTRMQKLVSWKEAGKVREDAKKWLTDDVGRVVGKNS